MAAMRFKQVQRFILVKNTFWGEGHFKGHSNDIFAVTLSRENLFDLMIGKLICVTPTREKLLVLNTV